MEHDFWHRRWRKNEIAFHEGRPNALLVKHAALLRAQPRPRVFLPLCGKTHDIHWLLAQGCEVTGAELSAVAVEQLFAELGIAAQKETAGGLVRWSGPQIEIFQGDIFALTAAMLGPVAAVYDRAALVALPPDMRPAYAAHMIALARRAPMLLITFDYDQAALAGPPFAVPGDEVERLYGGAYALSLLESVEVPGGLKGTCPAVEQAWAMTSR